MHQLSIVCAQNSHRQGADKSVVAEALLDTYSALSCCFLNPVVISESFIPGLRNLQRDLDPDRAKIAASILREAEAKLSATEMKFRSEGFQSGSGAGAGVDAMRVKMLDKFKDLREKMDLPVRESMFRKK